MKPEWMPPLPTPRKKPVYATSKNTASVRSGYEMGGYEKEPPLWDENQMHDYALAAVEAYKASLKPEMWGMLNDRGGWIKVAINGSSDEEMLTLGWTPLYRLDGGEDE